ncbi:MAG: class I SAM-dependent methyltransferase [Rhodothermia bacterium]
MTARLILLICFGIISLTASARPLWPIFVTASFVATVIVVFEWSRDRYSRRDVLFFAILIRVLLLPLPPSLSDDGYRYVWDGMLQWEGISPYLYLPTDSLLVALTEHPVFAHLNSADYFTVYPPLSQMAFFVGGWLPPESWFWSFLIIKIVIVVAEVGALFLLARMVSARALILYAWNPLVVVEIAGQAHTEGLLVAFLIMTVWAYRNDRPKLSLAALAAAVWVKLYPVFLIPFLLRRVGWRFIWVPILTSLLIVAPYWSPGVIANGVDSLKLYMGDFEFYAGPYLSLKWLLYRLGGTPGLEIDLAATMAISYLVYLGWLYVSDGHSPWNLARVFGLALAGYLVASTTIHPWHLLGLLVLIPFLPRIWWGWIWLTATSAGTYLLYSHDMYWIFVWIGWAGFLAIGAFELAKTQRRAWIRAALVKRAKQKADLVLPFLEDHTSELDRPLTVLDLGAGEGYVGHEIQKRGHHSVTLCDVRDSNDTDLPFVLYDGLELPFGDDWFDATILVFTLHHCEDHLAVIREAKRVTAGRIVILESVFDSEADRRILARLDRFANRLRSQGKMDEYLHFRKLDDWVSLFEREGFEVQSARRWGRVHKQALIVLEASV